MNDKEITAELFAHVREEFGSHGERAVGFLVTASMLLSVAEHSEPEEAPRIGEAVAHCLREGLKAIPHSHKTDAPLWRQVSREVVEAKQRYEAARNYPGADEDEALSDLLRRIESMDEFHRQERIHERKLLAVMLDRTGTQSLSDNLAGQYQRLVSQLSTGAHSSFSVDEGRKGWADCVKLLGRAFLPPELRFRELQMLAEKQQPSDADVGAVERLIVTPAHLRHFLAKIDGIVWLEKLTKTGLLDPPDDWGPWPVFGAVSRLSTRFSEALVDWLTVIYRRSVRSPSSAWLVGSAALDVGEKGIPLVVDIVLEHSEHHMVVLACRAATMGDASATELESIATFLFDRQSGYSDPRVQEIAARLVEGAGPLNVRRRIDLLCRQISLTPQDDIGLWLYRTRREGTIADSPEGSEQDRLEIIVGALVDIARIAQQERWITTEALGEMISGLPGMIGIRMRVWLLSNGSDVEVEALIEEIAEAIRSRRPYGDDVRLISTIVERASGSEYTGRWRLSLGQAPSVEEVGRAMAVDDAREEWMRAYYWLPLVPGIASGAWTDACSVIAAKYGALRADYLRSEEPEITADWVGSPFRREQIETMVPLEAARTIAEWRPGGDPWVSARELARTLQEVVQRNPQEWAADPVAVAMELKHPTYIQHYLRGVAAGVKDGGMSADKLTRLLALVRTHPWEPVPLGHNDFDYDRDWNQVDRATVDVIRALADSDVGFGSRDEEVWGFLVADTHDRSKPSGIASGARDPLELAINRPCTRAFEGVLACMAHEFRTRTAVRLQALELVEEVLRISGGDGLQFRAVLAPLIGFLHHIVPGWMERFRELMFGGEAPDGLGQRTLDQTLKWSQPNRWVLEEFGDGVRDAVRRGVDHSTDHFLFALFRGWSGYTPAVVERFLGTEPQMLAKAGHTIGRLLSREEVSSAHVDLGIQVWQRAIDTKRDPKGLKGFGWLAAVKSLDDTKWAELTAATLERTGGEIDLPEEVAERALGSRPSRIILQVMDKLVRAGDEGRRFMVERDARKLIERAADLAGCVEFKRLQTALLERGVMLEMPARNATTEC